MCVVNASGGGACIHDHSVGVNRRRELSFIMTMKITLQSVAELHQVALTGHWPVGAAEPTMHVPLLRPSDRGKRAWMERWQYVTESAQYSTQYTKHDTGH